MFVFSKNCDKMLLESREIYLGSVEVSDEEITGFFVQGQRFAKDEKVWQLPGFLGEHI